MSDQADQLRRLVREAVEQNPRLQPLPPAAVISGAAGGVGTTTVACLAATAVAQLGQRVLLIDADVPHPGVAERMQLPGAGTLGDVLSGRRRLCEAVRSAAANLSVLAGAPVSEGPPLGAAARARLLAELKGQRNSYDLVLIDGGAAATPWSDWLWQFAQHVLLVTSATPADLRATYAAVKQSRDRLEGANRFRLVVCEAPGGGLTEHAAVQFAATCERYLQLTPGAATLLPEQSRSDALRRAILELAAELLSGPATCHTRLGRVAGRRQAAGSMRAVGDACMAEIAIEEKKLSSR